jgi:hypothetical protein
MGAMAALPDRILLEPAIRAARKAIADIEIADTPAALRRMKASSARILPPPLAASLIDQIDKDDWLLIRQTSHWLFRRCLSSDREVGLADWRSS